MCHKSPYEVLLKKLPDYAFLKPFGRVCFAYLPTVNKLSPCSVICTHLITRGIAVLNLLLTVFMSAGMSFFMKMPFLFQLQNLGLPPCLYSLLISLKF